MLFALLLVYIAVSYIYPGQIFPELAPYRITYWVGTAGLVLAALWLVRRPRLLSTPQLWLLLAFTAVMGLSLMVAERWLGAPVYVLNRFGPSLTMFVLTICSVDSLRKLKIVAGLVVFLSMVLMLQGAAAYHFGYNSEMFLFDPVKRTEYVASVEGGEEATSGNEPYDSLGDESVRIRGLGLFHDPNDLALGFVVTIALLSGVWAPGAAFRNSAFVILPGLALVYGVFLTHSRGGMLAVLVTLLRSSGAGLNRIKSIILSTLLLLVVVASGFGAGRTLSSADDESARGRLTAWTEGMEMLKAQPILGIGYGRFGEYHELTAHNSLVLCFAETGLVGYFLWLGFVVVTFLQLQELKQRPADSIEHNIRRWAMVIQLALVGFMAAAFFLSRTFVPILYLIIGLGVALILIAGKADESSRRLSITRVSIVILSCEVLTIALIYVAIKLNLA